MCGIVGKYYFDQSQVYQGDLDEMLRSIIHRGPDSEGRYIDHRVILGFRRLSIIDTTSGDQPLFNEDGDITVLANGEIYNHLELKKLLQGKGHRFKTGSDCEVIVHLYEEYGPDFVNRLNGMFAFCIYDRRKQKMLLGRDRLGIKPLYVAKRDSVLVFASEIKAILQSKEIETFANQDALTEYLCFRALAGESTFFSGIDLLPPGTLLEVGPDGETSKSYWRPACTGVPDSNPDLVRVIQETLRTSVIRQLMSDVPLGTQLSGGVDSSWVSFLAAGEARGMKSFSVGFSEGSFDETGEARLVADLAGLEYHQVTSSAARFAETLPKAIWLNDEPLAHANSVEIYNLCRYAKQHVKVLLTGEGADELFGGYPRYYLSRLGCYHDQLPRMVRPVFCQLLNLATRGRGKQASTYMDMTPRMRVFWNSAFTMPDKVAWLLDRENLNFERRQALLEESWRQDLAPLDNLLLYELRAYLQPILLRQDKMSMGASIESRVPILDNEVIDIALRMTADQKLRAFQPKYLFKKAARRDLPGKIVNKRKVGFGVPVGRWMGVGAPLAGSLDRLLETRADFADVNPSKLSRLISEHQSGLVDHQDILWPLMNYSIWKDTFAVG